MSTSDPNVPLDSGENESPASQGHETSRDSADAASSRAAQNLDLLRTLLVGEETERIERLEHEPPPVKPLAEVLPDAISTASEGGEDLAKALRPTIEAGLMQSARTNPDQLAEAIYPVLGPAIKRSIRATLQASIQSLNVALENSLSPRGLRWRIEAWRTGKPFSEVALLHSLEYRVEQVYWIHKQTGLLLHGEARMQEGQKDPELVSGMLSAIQDFVQDSFEGAGEGELEQIEVSGFRVLLAQGLQSGLAALVRGIPPESLSEEVQETLDGLHQRYGEELVAFSGEVAPFQRSEEALRGLLSEASKEAVAGEAKGGRSKLGLYAIGGLLGLVLLWWGFSAWSTSRLESRRDRALAALAAEPGYWVQGGAESDRWSGLRDPLARPLDEVLNEALKSDTAQADLDVDWTWQAMLSLDVPMVHKRAHTVLSPPEGVRLDWPQSNRLQIAGEAPTLWIRHARSTAPNIAGVESVDWEHLIDTERDQIERRVESLDGLYLPFGEHSSALDRSRPEVESRLQSLVALDGRVLAYGGVLRLELNSILGQSENYDRALAQRRVESVQRALVQAGLQATIVQPRPLPSNRSAQAPRPGVRLGVRALLTESSPTFGSER